MKKPRLNGRTKEYWTVTISLDRIFDTLFILNVISRSAYDTAFDYYHTPGYIERMMDKAEKDRAV